MLNLSAAQRAHLLEVIASGMDTHTTDGVSTKFRDQDQLVALLLGDRGLDDPLALLNGRARPPMFTARLNFRP